MPITIFLFIYSTAPGRFSIKKLAHKAFFVVKNSFYIYKYNFSYTPQAFFSLVHKGD